LYIGIERTQVQGENKKTLYNRYALVAAVLASIALGYRPADAAPVAGDSEVQISGGLLIRKAPIAIISMRILITDTSPGWEVGFRQAVNYSFIHHGSDAWQATTTPFLHYNFSVTNVLVPYLGIFGGVVWNDRDVTGTMGPAAGVKLFVSDQTFVNIGYRYEWFFNSFEAARDKRTHGNHVVNIGLGFVWGGSGRKATN
jgi:hypothetical protein